jgi:hypothetical protein
MTIDERQTARARSVRLEGERIALRPPLPSLGRMKPHAVAWRWRVHWPRRHSRASGLEDSP